MTRCPFCFTSVDDSMETAFICVGSCGERPDDAASQVAGMPVSLKPVLTAGPDTTRRKPVRARGVRCTCGTPTSWEVCRHCHYSFPQGWRNVTTTCVAFAGARATGKSIYIGVLRQQAELLVEQLGGAMSSFDRLTEKRYVEDYRQPLFEARAILDPTVTFQTQPTIADRQPMIFSMGSLGGRRHILVLRDVAGEDLENPDSDPTTFGFFRRADCVFFLFDPLRVEGIREMLSGIVPEQRMLGGDPLVVLDNLVRILNVGQSSRRVSVPTAIVLSKFDALQQLGRVAAGDLAAAMRNPGAAMLRDPSLDSPTFDATDADLLEAEVRSLLARIGGTGLLNRIEESFEQARFFAVSALGSSPQNERLSGHGIAPFRCVDPLKWALHLSYGSRSWLPAMLR
jgi:hypothetical protein